MTMFDNCTTSQLFNMWCENWKAMATVIDEVVGDGEYPDPRKISKQLSEVPEDMFIGLFESEDFREMSRKQLTLGKVMTQIQIENIDIIETLLEKTSGES